MSKITEEIIQQQLEQRLEQLKQRLEQIEQIEQQLKQLEQQKIEEDVDAETKTQLFLERIEKKLVGQEDITKTDYKDLFAVYRYLRTIPMVIK